MYSMPQNLNSSLKKIRGANNKGIIGQLANIPIRVELRQKLQSMLTDHSSCYSLKVATEGKAEVVIGSHGKIRWMH